MRHRAEVLGLATLAAALAVTASVTSGAHGAGRPIYAYPIPGSRVASPQTQISFRGLPGSQLGGIAVTASRTGAHTGRTLGDSDGQGGSFVPDKPFAPGETVTVTTAMNVIGAGRRYRFTIATPAPPIPFARRPSAARVRGDLWRFRSRPDLLPAAVRISKRSGRPAAGDIFLAPQFGPVQAGPMILDQNGGLMWFKPLPGNQSASDFQVQTYGGVPVLTWWQGQVGAGVGTGQDQIADTSYRTVATVSAGNGLSADLHEFKITPQGTALLTAYEPVYWDVTTLGRSRHEIVLNCVVQEIDIRTGLVLFQWDSLDHVPVTDTFEPLPQHTTSPFDYFHVNSVEPDRDGNLVISGRNTWTAYKVDGYSGAIIWRLGGKHSSFRLASGSAFAFQHDVRIRANNDLFVTIFDNGAGPPVAHNESRGIKLILDLKHMTARKVAEHDHAPALLANFEGNVQQLLDRDDFVGWGQRPFFSEYDPRGRLIFDGGFVDANATYRTYRLPWAAMPDPGSNPPAVAAANSGKTTTVYASWNGANNVATWQVIAGSSPSSLQPVTTSPRRGFETAVSIPAQKYVAAAAIDANGHVLGQSATVRSK